MNQTLLTVSNHQNDAVSIFLSYAVHQPFLSVSCFGPFPILRAHQLPLMSVWLQLHGKLLQIHVYTAAGLKTCTSYTMRVSETICRHRLELEPLFVGPF